MEQYRDHATYRAGMVVKCGVCLGIVYMIALIGAHETGADSGGTTLALRDSASIQHSRALREQRMATYAAKRGPLPLESRRATMAVACAGTAAARQSGQPGVVGAACLD